MSFDNRNSKARLEMLKETPCYLLEKRSSKGASFSSGGSTQCQVPYQISRQRINAHEQEMEEFQKNQDRGELLIGFAARKKMMRDENRPRRQIIGSRNVSEGKEYHWRCQFCTNSNFPSNKSCFSCHAPKPITEILRTPVALLGPPGLFKEGDWQCFNCRNVNFKNRQFCNKCSEPKPIEYEQREEGNITQQESFKKPSIRRIDGSIREEGIPSRKVIRSTGEICIQRRPSEKIAMGPTDFGPKQATHPAENKPREQFGWRENDSQENQRERSRNRSFAGIRRALFNDAGRPSVSRTPAFSQRNNRQRFNKPQSMNHFR